MRGSIELYRNNDQTMNDAIDRLVVETHMYRQQLGYRTFLFSGCGSGSGTTTITINLAIALSMAGWKTVLVDCDFRKIQYKKIEEVTDMGLSDYLAGSAEQEDIIYNTNYDLLHLIPGGKDHNSPVRLLCSSRMEQLTERLREEYDYVIYDYPSLTIVPDASTAFANVDGVILIAALNQNTKRQVSDARRKVMQYDTKYCGMVVNKVERTQYKHYIEDYDYFKENNMKKRYGGYQKGKNRG